MLCRAFGNTSTGRLIDQTNTHPIKVSGAVSPVLVHIKRVRAAGELAIETRLGPLLPPTPGADLRLGSTRRGHGRCARCAPSRGRLAQYTGS
eukprot:2806284-Pyramimonas_sp.AAC.1